MKHLKTFENINTPQIGDYVICKDKFIDVKYFIDKNIGQILKFSYEDNRMDNSIDGYYVKYENVPPTLYNEFSSNNIENCRFMTKTEIIHFSPNKEKLEIYIQTNKYNL